MRDLADWIVAMVVAGRTGVYNATGPEQALSLGTLLETCVQVSGVPAHLTWVNAAFLEQQGVAPWSELPLWVPEGPETAGFSAFDCTRAIAAGLQFRPLADTIRDTLAWAATRPTDHSWRAGLSREREAAVLGAWHAQHP